MADKEQYEKKQFLVPSRDQLIQQIKDLDQEIQHVSLNLIKCDFNATQNDIKKTFSDFNFVKVKNYNAGSFEVVFQMKIDAINFIRNQYDKKVLSRRFFIKMGRQHKEVVEDWTGVGYVPRQFKGPHKPHHNQNKHTDQHQPKNTEEKQQNGQQNIESKVQEPKKQVEHKQFTKPVRQQVQTSVQQPAQQQEKKREGKYIPKTENAPKRPEYKKPANKQYGQKKTQVIHHVKKQGQEQAPKKQEPDQRQEHHKKEETKKEENKLIKKQEPVKKSQPVADTKQKKPQPVADTKQKKPQPVADTKQKKPQPVADTKQKKPQPVADTKQQDDGWIIVGGNKNNKKR